MRKIISFMHISLDGFVAGPAGEMNWITVNQEIFDVVEARISTTDTAMYGRKTFDMMESYWPTADQKANASKHDIEHARWYKNAHKIVLSKSLQAENHQNTKVISSVSADSINAIKYADGENNKDILVFGSPSTTHALIEAKLIDGYWLFVNPILLGQGIPLFKNVGSQTKLLLHYSKKFNCGVNELRYEQL